MKKIDVSIILLTRNAGKEFGFFLDKIFNQKRVNFEVVLIDTDSTDETLTIAEKYPIRIIRIKTSEFGHGKTRNLGARLAKGKYVVYITQDAIPSDNNWAFNLIKNFKDKSVAGIFGKQIPQQICVPPDQYSYKIDYPNEREEITIHNSNTRNVVMSDVNSAYKKDLLIKFPFLDELLVSEDTYWGNLMINKGYKIIYEPSAGVIHSHNYSIFKIFKINFDQGVGYFQMKSNHNSTIFIKNSSSRFLNKIKYLIKRGQFFWVLYVLIVDPLRFVAHNLGKRYRYLPKFIKNKLTNFPNIKL